jgi:formate dehydrogenase subunit beta
MDKQKKMEVDMSMFWKINTYGDPLKAVRMFLQTIWVQANLHGMLIPTNGSHKTTAKPQLIDTPECLEHVNPFRPLMTINAARLIPAMLHENPESKLSAVLRPCEMRAFVEMVKHDSFETNRLLTICLDCLGTYPADEYQWRVSRKESDSELTKEALQFARQGGMLSYRYRAACQTCVSPQAHLADINIHVLGLPVRQLILIETRNEETAYQLGLPAMTDGPAKADMNEQHQRVVEKILERHQHTMDRITHGLEELLPKNIQDIMAQLENCGACQHCMTVCPICSVHFPRRDQTGRYLEEQISRWLISCSGCGMCEQACSNHLPLSIIFGHIHDKLAEEFNYQAGLSFEEPLPF